MREVPPGTRAFLITPVDHAAVPPVVTETLIEAWQKGATLVVPTWQERGGHPVLIDASFREELFQLDANRGLRSLFDSHPQVVTRLSADSSYIARDMDTWDDYVTLHKELFGAFPGLLRVPDEEPPAVNETN